MSLESSERFSDRVDNYVKYRPGYPKDLFEYLEQRLGICERTVIADIGSGTGISAKPLLDTGAEVFGVEPNTLMRRAAEKYLAGYKNFRSVDGSAEKTQLESESVDVITAFQSFHWFDNGDTLKEFRRILRNEGYLVLVWNERRLDSNAFLREYERFLVEFGIDYKTIRHDRVTHKTIEKSFGNSFGAKTFINFQSLDFEGYKGRTLSASYIPNESDKRFGEMLEKLAAIFSAHEEKGRIRIPYDTRVFFGMI